LNWTDRRRHQQQDLLFEEQSLLQQHLPFCVFTRGATRIHSERGAIVSFSIEFLVGDTRCMGVGRLDKEATIMFLVTAVCGAH
jgi:hypothetical protein